MYRAESKYQNHPRITWFGIGGTVAYVDYISATESYFIGGNEHGGFMVIAPATVAGQGEPSVFDSMDAGIEYALAQVPDEEK
jgi:hypothetical protein